MPTSAAWLTEMLELRSAVGGGTEGEVEVTKSVGSPEFADVAFDCRKNELRVDGIWDGETEEYVEGKGEAYAFIVPAASKTSGGSAWNVSLVGFLQSLLPALT